MRKILILAAAVFAFCGCNDKEENQPFAGIDNHITSFALTAKDGTVYRAALVGDEIVVSIPRNVSLEGATADYELCEQAILYPDPARITDWDNEHRFRVMAYNQTLRDYAYSVKRNDVTAGSVALPTQADVEAFAATGATVIEGNLTIGDFSACDDPVTDLAPLAGLTDVRYNIVVGNSFAGEKLSGLENLRSAAVCVGMKRDVVRGDEFDRGQRALLNLGHTVGHAVEACSGFTLLHGEGVAIGMAIITRAAVEKGLCTPETLPRLLAALERYGLPTETDYSLTDILAAAAADKKRTDDVTKFIVPERVGHCRVEPVPADEVAGWLKAGGLR